MSVHINKNVKIINNKKGFVNMHVLYVGRKPNPPQRKDLNVCGHQSRRLYYNDDDMIFWIHVGRC